MFWYPNEVVHQRRTASYHCSTARTVAWKLRRRESNPQPPGYEPCTPIRQLGCVSKVTDEVVNQRIYGALPLSYSVVVQSDASGIRTHTPGSQSMYSKSAVGHVWSATKCVGQTNSVRELLPQTALSAAPDHFRRIACSPIRQSPCFQLLFRKKSNEVLPRDLLSHSVVRYQQSKSLTVDRPAHLAETPAPFTSRSPDIATLGPSCTPNRQLDKNQ